MTEQSPSQRHASSTLVEVCRFSLPAFLLTLSLGVFTGSVASAWVVRSDASLQIVEDTQTGSDVPVVRIEGIRNGELVGSTLGNIRLVGRGKIIAIEEDGSFAIRDNALLTNVITIHVPEGMYFVASRRGKKYYPVESASAQNLSIENRVYFPDEISAQKAGYTR